MGKTGEKNPIWDFFRSLKLTITILIILAALSVIGTLVPQKEGAIEFASRLSPTAVKVFFYLGLFDLYHSALFRLLLLALMINLVICSLDRFPKALKLYQHRPKVETEAGIPNPILEITLGSVPKEDLIRAILSALRLVSKKPLVLDKGDLIYAYAQKGRSSYFGVYVVHLSILVIIIGGLIGSFFGFEGYVNIPVGESRSTISLRDNEGHLHLDFSIRCDNFSVEYYPNGMPKEYRSTLTLLRGERELIKRDILVNHPLEFEGISFYQASYGKIADLVTLKISKGEESLGTHRLTLGSGIGVNENKEWLLLDARKNFMDGLGPAVLLRIPTQEGQKDVWVLKEKRFYQMLPLQMRQSPRFDPSILGEYNIEILDIGERFYTGIQVSKDPGVNVVWTGFVLMILGFYLTFFYFHRQIWVKARFTSPIKLTISGHTNKDPAGLGPLAQRIGKKIMVELEGRYNAH